MLYAFPAPGALWAVLVCELTYPENLDQESDQLLGQLGALAHGVGHLLLGAGVDLPVGLKRWATEPDVPMAELGSWIPGLVSVDETPYCALARDFGTLRVAVTLWSGLYVVLLVPAGEGTPALSTSGEVQRPPFG
jgi:hypothetical protein